MENEVIAKPERKISGYNPAITADTRRSVTSEIVRSHKALILQSEKVHLADCETVRNRAIDYMEQCESRGMLPSMEGFAAFCQLNRPWVYEYMSKHPKDATTELLQTLQTAWTACRINAAERGATGEALTIFLLKNSGQGFSDRIEVQPPQRVNPLDDLAPPERIKYILDGIPDDDDE